MQVTKPSPQKTSASRAPPEPAHPPSRVSRMPAAEKHGQRRKSDPPGRPTSPEEDGDGGRRVMRLAERDSQSITARAHGCGDSIGYQNSHWRGEGGAEGQNTPAV